MQAMVLGSLGCLCARQRSAIDLHEREFNNLFYAQRGCSQARPACIFRNIKRRRQPPAVDVYVCGLPCQAFAAQGWFGTCVENRLR